MDIRKSIINSYLEFRGGKPSKLEELPLSGSDRRYFRINEGNGTILGVFNPSMEENNAFFAFTKHFSTKNLPVPDLLNFTEGSNIYFIQDLGDVTLYHWMQDIRNRDDSEKQILNMYSKVLDKLILFQTDGFVNLDIDQCYPHRSFDRQSMMWDMNYFKYMFLKLIGAQFNEKEVEKDFNSLADFLLDAGSGFFLYRDFQSANIMIMNGEPWFIDYQGGRGGAPQYDPASLLFDAKAKLQPELRGALIEYYVGKFSAATGKESSWFRKYYPAFCLVRIMQAMGAYGLRGLVEKKPGFTESIVPAVADIISLLPLLEPELKLISLFSAIESIPGLPAYKELLKQSL